MRVREEKLKRRQLGPEAKGASVRSLESTPDYANSTPKPWVDPSRRV